MPFGILPRFSALKTSQSCVSAYASSIAAGAGELRGALRLLRGLRGCPARAAAAARCTADRSSGFSVPSSRRGSSESARKMAPLVGSKATAELVVERMLTAVSQQLRQARAAHPRCQPRTE